MGYLEEGRVVRGLEGDYHVERRLAKSRHHTLFTARCGPGGRGGERIVLLKELHASDIHEWSDIERLRAEARLLEDIRHARVPELIELFATDGDAAEHADRFTERFVRAPDGAIAEAVPGAGQLPSLILVRSFVPGESVEDAALRGRPLTPTQLEDILRDLLGIVATLHGMVPAVVHGEIDATRVVLDAASRAHLIGFGGSALRRKRADVAEPTRAIDDARAIARVIERMVGAGGIAASGLSTRARAVLRGLGASRSITSASAALAMLAEPPPPSALSKLGRSKTLRYLTLAVVSVSAHGLVLGSVLRSANKKAQAATPAQPAAPMRPAGVVPLAPPPPPAPPPRPLTPPPVFWTGQVLESSDALMVSTGGAVLKGAPCVMTADVSGSDDSATCSVSLTCGGALVIQDDLASTCEVVEKSIGDQSFQYRLKASSIGPSDGLSYRIEPGAAFVIDKGKRLRVKLAPTSNPQKWAGGRRLTHAALPFSQPSELSGLAVKVEGDSRVQSGDKCSLRFRPLDEDVADNCEVEVVCNGSTLYTKRATCRTDGTHVYDYRDAAESVIDGDASFVWDDHLLTLEDLTPVRREHVEIYLLEPKPVDSDE